MIGTRASSMKPIASAFARNDRLLAIFGYQAKRTL
jgi:hypothetical protein